MAIRNNVKGLNVVTIKGAAYIEMKIATVENTIDTPSLLFVPNSFILGVVRLWPKKPSIVNETQQEETLVRQRFDGSQLRYRSLQPNLNF